MQQQSDVKDFSYDHSYWSVDTKDKHYATQSQVLFLFQSVFFVWKTIDVQLSLLNVTLILD